MAIEVDPDPRPVVFRAYSARFAPAYFTLHVRTAGDPMALTASVRNAFKEVGVEMPFLDPGTMADFTTIPYWPHKVGAIMPVTPFPASITIFKGRLSLTVSQTCFR